MSDDQHRQNAPGPDRPLLLALEIDGDAPLEGFMSSSAGVTRPFAGWAGLASTLTTFLDDWGNPGDTMPQSGAD